MLVKFKKLSPKAVAPVYATDGSACFDFRVPEDMQYTIALNASMMVGAGIAVEVPPGHVMLLYSRSGHGAKNGVRLSNCVGVIDSDYRGEVMGSVRNEGNLSFYLKGGDRFMQGMVLPVEQAFFQEVSALSETARGEGGFGSTGVAEVKKATPPPIRSSSVHTMAVLEVAPEAYDSIRESMVAGGYGFRVGTDMITGLEYVDMTGISIFKTT